MDKRAKDSDRTDISLDLLKLYDDFADFNDDCAFLCDAFASLAANHECLDQDNINGLERHAYWLKQRVGEFKERIRQIREGD
jgi:hypothetical protein